MQPLPKYTVHRTLNMNIEHWTLNIENSRTFLAQFDLVTYATTQNYSRAYFMHLKCKKANMPRDFATVGSQPRHQTWDLGHTICTHHCTHDTICTHHCTHHTICTHQPPVPFQISRSCVQGITLICNISKWFWGSNNNSYNCSLES